VGPPARGELRPPRAALVAGVHLGSTATITLLRVSAAQEFSWVIWRYPYDELIVLAFFRLAAGAWGYLLEARARAGSPPHSDCVPESAYLDLAAADGDVCLQSGPVRDQGNPRSLACYPDCVFVWRSKCRTIF
jgi:hypothetical protein